MWSRVAGWFRRLGVGVYVTITLIFAVIIGGLRLFYRGKEAGAIEATAEADKERVREAAASGDSNEVLRLWRKARRKG